MNPIHHAIHCRQLLGVALFYFGLNAAADATFTLSQDVVEFNANTNIQQDIRLISHSQINEYIVVEICEIADAGLSSEHHILRNDTAEAGIGIAPESTILAAHTSQLLRFVLLEPLPDHERVFRVTVHAMINDRKNMSTMMLKPLVEHTVWVIVRPTAKGSRPVNDYSLH